MAVGCQLLVPHGGIFVLAIPNAVVNLPAYILTIVVGTLVTTGMLFLLKKPLGEKAQVFAREVAVA